MRHLGRAALVAVVTLTGAEARADDVASAVALYGEGIALMEAGRLDQACPKLTASFALAPTVKTRLGIALCHEREGRIATAFADYRETAVLAKQAGDNARRDAALARASELEPRIPHVVVRPHAGIAEVAIRLNGEALPPATWNVRIPVDPGAIKLHVDATAHEPFDLELTIAERAETVIDVPPLRPRDAAAARPSRDVAAGARVPWWGWGAVGVGTVAATVGIVAGISAVGDAREADDHCPSSACNDAVGVRASERADAKAWVANVAVGAAIVFAAVAIYAFVSTPGVHSRR